MDETTLFPLSQGQFSYTMLKATEKSSAEPEEEVIKIEDEYPEVDTRGIGVINPVKAWHHVQKLDKALQVMMVKLDGEEIKDVLKDTL